MLTASNKNHSGYKINADISAIGTVGKYEGITFRRITIWCVISGIQNLQSKGDPSLFGFLHIP